MKREYVKPVMECEAFVANEYVATCYQIYCAGYEKKTFLGESHDEHGFQGPVSKNRSEIEALIKPYSPWWLPDDWSTVDSYRETSQSTRHFKAEVRESPNVSA